MAELIVSIDDTDDIDSKGTGAIADGLRRYISDRGYGECGYITRHQLLIHPDIPYTSHNSAMAFTLSTGISDCTGLADELSAYVLRECAPSSDPGVCVLDRDDISDPHALIRFGYLAKNRVLTKALAYTVAQKTGAYLKELAGTGDGVIGALAGAALRRSGNDGELRGGVKEFVAGKSYRVAELLESPLIDAVKDINGAALSDHSEVFVPWKIKPVLTDGALTVFIKRADDSGWVALEKKENRDVEFNRAELKTCTAFKEDASEELVLPDADTCLNCIYRRWLETGFTCVLGNK